MHNTQKEKVIVGLTGQSGAGKSTVASVFIQRGFLVVDADKVARTITDNIEVVQKLVELFGQDVATDNKLNRKVLANIVFSDKNELQRMNNLLFPIICDKMLEIANNSKYQYILFDAPQLFESGLNKICHKIIAVVAPRPLLIERITRRDNISIEDAEKRLNAQLSVEFFTENTDYTITSTNNHNEWINDINDIINQITGASCDVFEF